MTLLRLPLLLPLAWALALAGCGDSSPATGARSFGGPPRWRLSRSPRSAGELGLTVNVRTPIRVRLRHEGAGVVAAPGAWRELAVGQSLTVVWGQEAQEGEGVPDRPKPEAEASGHTEAHAVRIQYHFNDEIVNYHRWLEWTRSGRGRLQTLDALPPGTYEELPLRGSVELLTAVISDLGSGTVRLRRRGHATVVSPPEGVGAEDRVLIRRVFLDFEPLDAP